MDLKYILDTLGVANQARLAEIMDVEPATVSLWGTQPAGPGIKWNLRQLAIKRGIDPALLKLDDR